MYRIICTLSPTHIQNLSVNSKTHTHHCVCMRMVCVSTYGATASSGPWFCSEVTSIHHLQLVSYILIFLRFVMHFSGWHTLVFFVLDSCNWRKQYQELFVVVVTSVAVIQFNFIFIHSCTKLQLNMSNNNNITSKHNLTSPQWFITII
jgi:hypothetical protein